VNMTRTVRMLERAGAAGIQIEDQIFPKKCGHFKGKDVVPLDDVDSADIDLAGRLAELVDPDGAVVLNADDPVSSRYAGVGPARSVLYGFGPARSGGVGVIDGWIVDDEARRILPVDELAIPGEHNISNALAAVATGLVFGIPPEDIRRAATAFEGVEHRLEQVSVVDGVRFVNDSQGTQPDAVVAALRSFDPPIVLIAGGRDKDVDLSGLGPVVAERAIAAVLIGESGPSLETLFRAAGLVRTERADSLDKAVRRADAIAREQLAAGATGPVTVLLSPAAASFDMFIDYAARGRAFKAAVAELARERQGRRTE